MLGVMRVVMNKIPKYIPKSYDKLMATIDPVEMYDGYSIKRGENFSLISIDRITMPG